MFKKQLHIYEACTTCFPWVFSFIIKIPSEFLKGSPGELCSFVLHAQTKLQEFRGRCSGGSFSDTAKWEIRFKQPDKIDICDESIIVKGNTEFGQISNHFCDRVEIHGAE